MNRRDDDDCLIRKFAVDSTYVHMNDQLFGAEQSKEKLVKKHFARIAALYHSLSTPGRWSTSDQRPRLALLEAQEPSGGTANFNVGDASTHGFTKWCAC